MSLSGEVARPSDRFDERSADDGWSRYEQTTHQRFAPLGNGHPDTAPAGLDRVSLSFPVERVLAEDHEWDSITTRDGRSTAGIVVGGRKRRGDPSVVGSSSHVVEGPGTTDTTAAVMVGVSQMPNGTLWGKVETNPSRLADPDGCSLLPFDQAQDALAAMWLVAGQYLEAATPLEEANVKRLDVARDFRDVQVPGVYVRGLLNVRRAWARKSFTYHNPQRGHAETLFVGSGAGGVRLYDQHEAYAFKGAPEGSLRWECEARAKWVERYGMGKAGDVAEHRLLALAWDRWDWSQMGRAVTGSANVAGLIGMGVRQGLFDSATGRPSWARADRLLGQLVRESHGLAAPSSKQSAAEYNKIKRALGVTAGADLFADIDGAVMGRLDFSTGREVAVRGPAGADSPADDGVRSLDR